jgi:hypothetical protein
MQLKFSQPNEIMYLRGTQLDSRKFWHWENNLLRKIVSRGLIRFREVECGFEQVVREGEIHIFVVGDWSLKQK